MKVIDGIMYRANNHSERPSLTADFVESMRDRVSRAGSSNEGQLLFVSGLSFKTAPVALREQLAVAPTDQVGMARKLKERAGLEEVVLLWTCNRVEIYGVAKDPVLEMRSLIQCLSPSTLDLDKQVFYHEGDEAVRHLFRVASGLESMVLGEPEITGQVKGAYHNALSGKLTGPRLNRLFQKALRTAKAIRTDTSIGQGAASVGSVCVERAESIFHDGLSTKKVLIIGAGKMAETSVRHFAKKGAKSIIVANRSLERAEDLARQFDGRAARFDDIIDLMKDADIVVSSTGCPVAILQAEDMKPVMDARAGRPLFMIDIAVPRDIAPEVGELPGIHLDDIDDMQETVRSNVEQRREGLGQCLAMIDEKLSELNEAERMAELMKARKTRSKVKRDRSEVLAAQSALVLAV